MVEGGGGGGGGGVPLSVFERLTLDAENRERRRSGDVWDVQDRLEFPAGAERERRGSSSTPPAVSAAASAAAAGSGSGSGSGSGGGSNSTTASAAAAAAAIPLRFSPPNVKTPPSSATTPTLPAEFRVLFKSTPLGITLTRGSSSGTAIVTRVAGAGQALLQGVQEGDVVVGVENEWTGSYEEVMRALKQQSVPYSILFRRAFASPRGSGEMFGFVGHA